MRKNFLVDLSYRDVRKTNTLKNIRLFAFQVFLFDDLIEASERTFLQ
jgi:hypothetical protein